jgi:hypothetical protein
VALQNPIPLFNISVAPQADGNAWGDCWEQLLRLPLTSLSCDELQAEAKRLVQSCYSQAGDGGYLWFEWQVLDGQLFVNEQLANDPDHLEWQRIDAVLAGSRCGLCD